jgi:hypothetical protein
MAAFAMKLPATLGEQQLACIQRYGAEHCEEFRVNTEDPTVTIFAGVLRHRFTTKKTAQNAFGLNLKTWGIDRGNKSTRGWYRELTVDQYLAEFRDVPGTAGRRMHVQVWGILNKCNEIALHNVAKALAEKEKKEAEALQKEGLAKTCADIEERRAARFALDPVGNTEKERAARETSAMRQDGMWAERIRHAESLPPPKKRPRGIHELPHPRNYIDNNRDATRQVAQAVAARANLESEMDKHKATFGDGDPDGLALLKKKEENLKNDYAWAWRERIDAEMDLHRATFGCNGDREGWAMLQMKKQHLLDGLV